MPHVKLDDLLIISIDGAENVKVKLTSMMTLRQKSVGITSIHWASQKCWRPFHIKFIGIVI